MIAKSHRWQQTAMVAALCGLWGFNAMALSLGRITVQSALGEPLRAEVEVLDINAEEASSLRASIALPEAFRSAGLEYNPALASLQATLQRRADGRAYIRLNGDRAINDPFVDLILETNWATGRIVRDYTLLFDPPNLRAAAPTAPTPAQVTAASPAGRTASATKPATPATPGLNATQVAEPGSRIAAKAPVPAAVVKPPAGRTGQVTVKAGDTASRIAAATKPDKVSLDQMLVALLRTNPAAFMGDNINRIKAGAILDLPTAEQAGTTSAAEATQIIVAQSKDFNDFRRRLAVSAPDTPTVAASRQTSGTVQASVDDRKPAAAAPDKLTLSKGGIQKLPAEDKLVKDRSAREAASRVAEIAKNISDLSSLGAASKAVAGSPVAPASAAAQPGAAAVTSTLVNPPPAAPLAASAASATAATGAASAPVRTASGAAKAAPAMPLPQPQTGLLDGLMESPLVPAGAVGLIALLTFFGLYRARQRKNAAQVDSVFLENHLRPDSFFGGSGGQSVDTHNGPATGSSLVYSPSQLDAVDDVDPVAEADVYLAYGRDLQAEEILKDALRNNPGRLAIHQKLLELFSKRRDIKSFENIAVLAFKASNGEGPDWERIRELGLSVDANNPLYLPGGQPRQANGSPSRPAPLDGANNLTDNGGAPRVTQPSAFVDLDLDFSLDEAPAGAIHETSSSVAETTPGPLDAKDRPANGATAPIDQEEETPGADANALDFALPDAPPTPPVAPPQVSASRNEPKRQPATEVDGGTAVAPDFDMLEFDLGSLSLDLEDSVALPPADQTADTHEDPLATKLALAEEFGAIGDKNGARALIEEVIAEASGDMKLKAQRALGKL
ncbi:MAG: fimbrial protein FimV [Rhodoferax sp.]|uniref:FimV/HubP family polar landmark protein n=1 Tax=Rhodoferax sp. TaxID=50421 RepID=UPI002604A3BA|nr:FimV/HubP family polar landmark protein [Rhodoferax sp.]MDD5332227.1 fimbrial protein FimV [Rhodoferax sp.]